MSTERGAGYDDWSARVAKAAVAGASIIAAMPLANVVSRAVTIDATLCFRVFNSCYGRFWVDERLLSTLQWTMFGLAAAAVVAFLCGRSKIGKMCLTLFFGGVGLLCLGDNLNRVYLSPPLLLGLAFIFLLDEAPHFVRDLSAALSMVLLSAEVSFLARDPNRWMSAFELGLTWGMIILTLTYLMTSISLNISRFGTMRSTVFFAVTSIVLARIILAHPSLLEILAVIVMGCLVFNWSTTTDLSQLPRMNFKTVTCVLITIGACWAQERCVSAFAAGDVRFYALNLSVPFSNLVKCNVLNVRSSSDATLVSSPLAGAGLFGSCDLRRATESQRFDCFRIGSRETRFRSELLIADRWKVSRYINLGLCDELDHYAYQDFQRQGPSVTFSGDFADLYPPSSDEALKSRSQTGSAYLGGSKVHHDWIWSPATSGRKDSHFNWILTSDAHIVFANDMGQVREISADGQSGWTILSQTWFSQPPSLRESSEGISVSYGCGESLVLDRVTGRILKHQLVNGVTCGQVSGLIDDRKSAQNESALRVDGAQADCTQNHAPNQRTPHQIAPALCLPNGVLFALESGELRFFATHLN